MAKKPGTPISYKPPASAGKPPRVVRVQPARPAVPAQPKYRPPAQPAWKGLNQQLKNFNEPNAITYGWSQGLANDQAYQGYLNQQRPQEAAPAYSFDGGALDMQVEPYTGISSSLLESQQTEDLGVKASSMQSRIRQALVDLGLTDTAQLSEGARGYVDPATLEAAAKNKYSLFSQIAQKSAKQNAMARARLAAKGMLSSGQLTKETKDIMEEAEQGRYTGVREFTGGVGSLLAEYAQRQREWASKIAEARFQEAQYQAYANSRR